MSTQRRDSLDDLVEALAAWAGTGALIIDHMSRAADRGHGDGPIHESFDRILRSALRPLADRHAATDLEAAADVLGDVVETVGNEVFLVDLDAMEDEA